MSNFYQHYYQSKKSDNRRCSWNVDRVCTMKKEPTQKQIDYYNALRFFVESKGIELCDFQRPKTNQDYRGAIKGLITLIGRKGFKEEFFSNGG